MTTAWRLVAPKWAASAFDGEGARLTGGRWNTKGVPLVYLASSLALAALELLVHIDYRRALEAHVALSATFDEQLALYVRREDLPIDWTKAEQIPHTQALGDAWARSRTSAILAVPSSVVPSELNYLLNPEHPDAKTVRVGRAEPFCFDPRLLNISPRSGPDHLI